MATNVERLAASELGDLLPAIMSGARLSRGECMRLWRTADLTSLGVLANQVRECKSGARSFFRSAAHVNPTGLPDPGCPECTAAAASDRSFSRLGGLGEDFRKTASEFAGELHLTGGPDPSSGMEELCRQIRQAAALCPQLRLRAFTWRQLESAAEKDRELPREVLTRLMDAGLMSLAGGALVDLSPARPHLGSESITSVERRMPWIRAAAELKLKCELSWVSGDEDDPETTTEFLARVREIQDHFPIFECVVPLAFNCPSGQLDLPMPTGYNHLRAVAIGRLFLDNFPRVRSSPFAVGEPLAQIAQWYGADDAGSASPAGPGAKQTAQPGRERMSILLREAGREPVEI